jgi:hypothetical protein
VIVGVARCVVCLVNEPADPAFQVAVLASMGETGSQ